MEKKIVSGIMTVLLLIIILSIAFVHIVRSADIIHDVAVTGIGFHHSTVYRNITVSTTYNVWDVNLIYVDAEIYNNGEVPETVETTFTYTIANVPTTIGVVFVDVATGSTEKASVSLDTRGFPVGYLPITVEATQVPNEGNTLNNNMNTTLWIKQVGDVRGDPTDPDPIIANGHVNRYDHGAMAQAYGYVYPHPLYNVEADFNRDGAVDRYDYGYLAQNYGILLPPYEPL